MKQCKSCPWKRSTVASRDIPGGYDRAKHEALRNTIANGVGVPTIGCVRMMACHDTPVGRERPCTGWVANQLGPGNNLPLRMLARDGRFSALELDGEQWEHFEETLR